MSTFMNRLNWSLLETTGYSFQLVYRESKQMELASSETRVWRAYDAQHELGMLTAEAWQLWNHDLYYFIRYEPSQTSDQILTVRLPFGMDHFEYRYLYYPEAVSHQLSQWSDTFTGSAPASLPAQSVFINDGAIHAFLTYIQIFEKNENLVYTELWDERMAVQLNEEGAVLHLPQRSGTAIEHWGMLSNSPLVDLTQEPNLALIRLADLNMARKWTREGPLEPTPSTYYPSSPSSFFINPSYAVAQRFLKLGEDRYFENMTVIALHTAARTINEDGYWPISTRSGWLYEDYGMEAGYYDTRWSTDAAVFLLDGYRSKRVADWLEAAKRYAEFYLKYAEDYHYSTQNGGWLVWDYMKFDSPQIKPVHVSLNHLLAEMNFLYEIHQITGEQRYLEGAERLRTAVHDTGMSWVNEAGDLHYRYQPDGSYTGKDYPLLTLKDLRISQALILELEGQADPVIAGLIQAKEAYLKANNLPLYD